MTPFLSSGLCRLPTACCLLAMLAGCTGQEQVVRDRAVVSGTVTLDGQPLPAGTIGFESADGPVSTPAKIRDGAYSTDRAPIGKNLVTVDTTSIKVGNPANYVPIPAKYQNPSTSDLTAEIEPGNNENVNFALEK